MSGIFSRNRLLLDRCLWRWGSGGSDLTKLPTAFPKVTGDIASLGNGSEHSAVVIDGKVFAYGSNRYSQLGSQQESSGLSLVDAPWENVPPVSSVSCGNWHTTCVHGDGSVSAFGWGGSFFGGAGALGLGSKRAVNSLTQLSLESFGGEKIIKVSSGAQHTLFLSSSGKRLFATGQGAYGILGNGDSSDELFPVEITSLVSILEEGEKIEKVSTGQNFSALLTDRGNLYVWGRNDCGQLGLGEESQGDMHSAERYPRKIPFFELERTIIKDVVCGDHHMVALANNGALYYWGDRTWLEPHLVALPEQNGGIKGIKKIAAGAKTSFILTEEGLVYVWGSKGGNLLIDSTQNIINPLVVDPAFFKNQKVVDIHAGRHRCSAVSETKELIATSDEEARRLGNEFQRSS